LNFVQFLEHHLRVAIPGIRPRFIVDTGRNGITISREDCEATCNLRAASFGRAPTTQTDLATIDAYFWLLPPGSSDGCSHIDGDASVCAHPTAACTLDDALGTRAGEASAPSSGELFIAHLRQLATQSMGGVHGEGHDLELDAMWQQAKRFSKLAGLPLSVPATVGQRGWLQSLDSWTDSYLSYIALGLLTSLVLCSWLVRRPQALVSGDNDEDCDNGDDTCSHDGEQGRGVNDNHDETDYNPTAAGNAGKGDTMEAFQQKQYPPPRSWSRQNIFTSSDASTTPGVASVAPSAARAPSPRPPLPPPPPPPPPPPSVAPTVVVGEGANDKIAYLAVD